MQPSVKNTGMSSLNELFAMKKNLSHETKFNHILSGMTRDYFHKKENMTQEIRAVYNDLKNIQSSTGYSLNQAKSVTSVFRNPRSRRPTLQKIYLPPIGVRLVKKYVGIDVKRHPLNGRPSPKGAEATPRQQPDLESIMNRTIGQRKVVDIPRYIDSTRKLIDLPQTGNVELSEKAHTLHSVKENDSNKEEANSKAMDGKPSILEDNETKITTESENFEVHINLPFVLTREAPLEETFHLKETDQAQGNPKATCEVLEDSKDTNVVGNNGKVSSVIDENEETFLLEPVYNLTERRSSRSTFRGRSSVRLPSSSSLLSEYNLEVVALSKTKSTHNSEKQSQVKEKIGNFYLDYGDGILHDSMEIPKVKDCSRPWCNPYCKTCRNRTFSRPCFVLIPAAENARKRQLPLDKRNMSKFPIYPSSVGIKGDETSKNAENTQTESAERLTKNTDGFVEKMDKTDDADDVKNMSEDAVENDLTDDDNKETETENEKLTTKPEVQKRKKGYSRKRMDELSQPKGGPPAEVRFSKTSLRRIQGELIEDERRKALTEIEKINLTNIQGRISMFLALLNEKELMNKPMKMVDIPMRMDVGSNEVPKDKKIRKKRKRNVHFSPRAKVLSE